MNRKIFACILVFVFLVGLSSVSFAQEGEKLKGASATGLFDKSLKVEVSSIKNKTALVFSTALCTKCIAEINDIMKNLDVIKTDIYVVSVDSNPQIAEKIYDRFKDKIKILHDPEYKMGNALNVKGTPTTVIIENGAVSKVSSGYIKGDWEKF